MGNGRWVKRVTLPHECQYPPAFTRECEKLGVGSIWQCNCGQQWELQAPNGVLVMVKGRLVEVGP